MTTIVAGIQRKTKSRNFVIRTTEKEPELVQACLDQLLARQQGVGQLLMNRLTRTIGQTRR